MSIAIMAWIPELAPGDGADARPAGSLGEGAGASVAASPHAAGGSGVGHAGTTAAASGTIPRGPDDRPAPAAPILLDVAATPRHGDPHEAAAGATPPPALPRPAPQAPRVGAGFPAVSIVFLAAASAVVWGMAWRNEHLRLEAQRRGPERLARQPADAAAATGAIRP